MCAQVSRAVQAWEPREERIPLHAWLHPWLELLGRQLEDLYPTIRFKLASALQSWHPSDGSALALLSPWHTVRSPFPGHTWILRQLSSSVWQGTCLAPGHIWIVRHLPSSVRQVTCLEEC